MSSWFYCCSVLFCDLRPKLNTLLRMPEKLCCVNFFWSLYVGSDCYLTTFRSGDLVSVFLEYGEDLSSLIKFFLLYLFDLIERDLKGFYYWVFCFYKAYFEPYFVSLLFFLPFLFFSFCSILSLIAFKFDNIPSFRVIDWEILVSHP